MSELLDTLTSIRPLVDRALALATPPDLTIPVAAGASLQAAVDAAPAGATLALGAGTYQGTLTLAKPITIQPRHELAPGRASMAAVWIAGTAQGVNVVGPDIALRGIGIGSASPTTNLVAVTGPRFTLDRCVVLGGQYGARRGVMLNGDTAAILGCRIDECWQNGAEAQAIAGWDGTRNVLIDDCYLGGASQSVMFGGGDSLSPDRVPTGIVVRRSLLTKTLAWAAKGAVIKTAFELKSAIGVHLHDCALEYAGTSAGQGAYLIVLKSLNQDGHAPWSTVHGVLIERVTARAGGGCVSFVGNDGPNPSERMANVTLRDVAFTEIDPQGPTGGVGRGFTFQSGAINVTLENVSVQAQHMAASMYFMAPQPARLVLRNVALPSSTYGVKIDNFGAGLTALKAWAPDAVLEGGGVSA